MSILTIPEMIYFLLFLFFLFLIMIIIFLFLIYMKLSFIFDVLMNKSNNTTN